MGEQRAAGNRVERLRDAAAELARHDSERDIFEYAVDVVQDLVGGDGCVVLREAEGTLVPAAARDTTLHFEATPLRDDEGVAGTTLGGEDGKLIDDVRADPDAAPRRPATRAALSVPVGDDAVLQVVADRVGAYDETDLELAELLADHVEHAVERVRYEATVERERDRFAALFQNVPDAAVQYRLDDDGSPRIQRVNSAFVRLFGYEPAAAVGETTADLLVPDDDCDAAETLYDDVRTGERLDVEVTRETADGPHPFLLRSVPVWAESGDVTDRVGYFIYTDIGEMRERERELTRKNERLDAFTSIVSHDLRNPLGVAQGYLEKTRDGAGDHLDTVAAELDRMDRMIDELLTLARQGELVGETTPVDIENVARAAWSHVSTGDARLVVADSTTVTADRDRLVELLENLFRNAVEHGSTDSRPKPDESADHGTPPSESDDDTSTAPTVTVGTLHDGGFYVADDGPGIPADQRAEVFEMGVSTAEDGTGFGLSIVERIAEAHGWEVSVGESADGGARFEIAPGGGE